MPAQQDLVVNRMGVFDYKGKLELFIKELFGFFPFGNFVLHYVLGIGAETSQTIGITISDEFNNQEFQLQTIILTLSNKSLQYKAARIIFETRLSPTDLIYGYRYFMYTYFYTTATVAICALLVVNVISLVCGYLVLRMLLCKKEHSE